MSKAKKLQLIEKIRKQHERNAGRQHGETIRIAEQQKKQLDELLQYRDQYAKSFQTACEAGLTAIRMQEYQVFINRLDEAIFQQKQQILSGQDNCKKSRKEWLTKRNERKMLSKVVESRQQSEREQKDRREQRAIEDQPHKVIVSS